LSQDVFRQALLDAVEPWGLDLTDQQVGLMWAHFERMVEANRVFNLTRITDPVAAATQLYADSLSVVAWARAAPVEIRNVIDVGTGAGIPAIPLAVTEPGWSITAIDGTAKKIRFVSEVSAALGLMNVQALHARAELWRPPVPVDLAVAKAVGPMADCLLYFERLVRTNGHGVCFKTPKVPPEELTEAQSGAAQLGFVACDPYSYSLRAADGPIERVLYIYRKVRKQTVPARRRRRRE
jgi:16S rRNA (guanine527-N7)-methyltransferase